MSWIKSLEWFHWSLKTWLKKTAQNYHNDDIQVTLRDQFFSAALRRWHLRLNYYCPDLILQKVTAPAVGVHAFKVCRTSWRLSEYPCENLLVVIGTPSLSKPTFLAFLASKKKFFTCLFELDAGSHPPPLLNFQASFQPDFAQKEVCLAACDRDDFSFLFKQRKWPQLPSLLLIEDFITPLLLNKQSVLRRHCSN